MGSVLERFGGAQVRARFDAFVDAGRGNGRRPEWSGTQDAGETAKVRSTLADGHRRSDGMLGALSSVERACEDHVPVRAPLAARGTEHRAGPLGRPALREVVDAVLEFVGIQPIAFEERTKAHACVFAKRMITWLWVHEYGGQQIEVARMLGMETGAVSRHYRKGLIRAGDFDEAAAAVVALIRRRAKPRPRTKTRPTSGGLAVRYFVDVDET